ncbi:hypothetical protein DM02DRAFT_658640 [Periconia macrospinosa]|uniref:F-box domain-containing protein n=1 Tax=Periconia macrospinosa TaxID=97972 RepID=A0A2V1DG95_9PLEO|nr:hypothetical protein DM02DRAFT_658640 [Periconia macrospinosa]
MSKLDSGKPFPFLKLPAELRLEVYKHLQHIKTRHHDLPEPAKDHPEGENSVSSPEPTNLTLMVRSMPLVSLLTVSKPIHSEVSAFLRKSVEFEKLTTEPARLLINPTLHNMDVSQHFAGDDPTHLNMDWDSRWSHPSFLRGMPCALIFLSAITSSQLDFEEIFHLQDDHHVRSWLMKLRKTQKFTPEKTPDKFEYSAGLYLDCRIFLGRGGGLCYETVQTIKGIIKGSNPDYEPAFDMRSGPGYRIVYAGHRTHLHFSALRDDAVAKLEEGESMDLDIDSISDAEWNDKWEDDKKKTQRQTKQ